MSTLVCLFYSARTSLCSKRCREGGVERNITSIGYRVIRLCGKGSEKRRPGVLPGSSHLFSVQVGDMNIKALSKGHSEQPLTFAVLK